MEKKKGKTRIKTCFRLFLTVCFCRGRCCCARPNHHVRHHVCEKVLERKGRRVCLISPVLSTSGT